MQASWLGPYLDRMEAVSRRFFRFFHDRVEAEGGLSPSQHYLLKVLHEHGPHTISDLATRLGTSAAGSTGLVDRLVRAGLVHRTRDEVDRRVVRVRLSEEGALALAKAHALRRRILADLFHPLAPREVEQLVTLFEKMASAIPFPDGDKATKE